MIAVCDSKVDVVLKCLVMCFFSVNFFYVRLLGGLGVVCLFHFYYKGVSESLICPSLLYKKGVVKTLYLLYYTVESCSSVVLTYIKVMFEAWF